MPEFVKKNKRHAKEKWQRKFYFCDLGRTGSHSFISNFILDGYEMTKGSRTSVYKTRQEIFDWYDGRRGIDKILPEESYAVVRHPIERIESHIRWMVKSKKAFRKENGFFDFVDYSLDNIYDSELMCHLIPAFESILFDATVLQYELGNRKIADYFVENKIVSSWNRIFPIKDEGRARINWLDCPDSIRDKILKTYEKDFENFDYDPFEYLKK